MKYSFKISIKGASKDSIANSLAKIAGVKDTRGYVSKYKTAMFSKNYPESRKISLISVESIDDENYIIKLNNKTAASFMKNTLLKHLGREIRINPDSEDD